MIKTTLLLAALLLPSMAAQADDHQCAQSEPRNLQLDFSGIDTVVFEIGSNTADIRASKNATGKLEGRACASNANRLAAISIDQRREGSTLTVRALRNGKTDNGINVDLNFFSKTITSYAYLTFTASVPDTVLVKLDAGSGNAKLDGARAAVVDVGSGDAEVSRIAETLSVKVGSGDLIVRQIGALKLGSVGSGDATARQVRGNIEVGSVGSGDLKITGARGAIDIGSIGSGDAELTDIGGDVIVGSIGSGDLDVNGVKGALTVRSVGSGDVRQRNVSGRVDVPKDR